MTKKNYRLSQNDVIIYLVQYKLSIDNFKDYNSLNKLIGSIGNCNFFMEIQLTVLEKDSGKLCIGEFCIGELHNSVVSFA